jgi:purine-binding chemotaxis protein CheW
MSQDDLMDDEGEMDLSSSDSVEYVTVTINGQLFGMPISRVEDIFMPQSITSVPLSDPEVEGVLNLRGRIVTAINMRKYLGLPQREDGEQSMAVGVEYRDESYGLIIDGVGEVLRLSGKTFEENPTNLDPCWSRISQGVHRLENELMLVLDIECVLDPEAKSKAA